MVRRLGRRRVAVEEVLGDIEDETGQATYNMPKRHEFHVGAKFHLDGPQTQTSTVRLWGRT